ncbi:MAG: DNRLRE domain-containing protein [Chloroflexi bacterium]|nr:DNRLRE domain-containing protein [Chloroflexota bacterium]
MHRPRQGAFWRLAFLGLLLLVLAPALGLGRAGIIDIQGTMRLYILPQPYALVKAGPVGGPYSIGPFAVSEGSPIEFLAWGASDPSGGTLTFEWDFDYDGVNFTSDATGPGPVQYTYPDGPRAATVALRLTSSTGAIALCKELVSVLNVAPTAAAGGPYSGVAGSPITFAGSATDPSSVDTAAKFVFEWDFDYSGTFAADQSGLDLTGPSYTYASGGSYTVALRVNDKDGGVSNIATSTVQVTNPILVLNAGALADTYVDQSSATTNYGTATELDVQSYSNNRNRRGLVKFDLSAVPANATIVSATLKLYAFSVPSSARMYGAYRITSTWTETGVTWNAQPTLVLSPTASATTPGSMNWVTWDVTADVQAMVNGVATNYGWMFIDAVENSSTAYVTAFSPRESVLSSVRPVLVIQYQTP